MTRQELAALACKVIAVWLFTQALVAGGSGLFALLAGQVTSSSFRFADRDNWYAIALVLTPSIGSAVMGWVLWSWSWRLARLMVADDPSPVQLTSASVADLLSIALALSGVFVALNAIHRLVIDFAMVARSPYPLQTYTHDLSWNATIFAHVVELGLAAWLIFGSRGMAALIRRVRETPGFHMDSPTVQAAERDPSQQ